MFGIGVSPGISIGSVCILQKSILTASGHVIESPEKRTEEIERFEKAVNASVIEIEELREKKKDILRQEERDILDTQVELLTDPQIRNDVAEKINNEFKTASDAVIEVIEAAAEIFKKMDDEYFRARTADVQDIGQRIVKNLNSVQINSFSDFPDNTIIIADDLSPSDTISFDITKIAGFATRAGGRTSHTAVIARSKGIPAVVGCGDELMKAETNDIIIIDGAGGEVILKPDDTTLEIFRERQKKYSEGIASLRKLKDVPAITPDGRRVKLFANIASADDLANVFANGGEGVGLLRTELLFMNRDSFPGEEEQFNFYRQVAVKADSHPVIIRTLDIGGDKNLSYFEIPFENNPFLGYRAIRICLDRKDIFLTQLRAILRASAFGRLKIMFPMISNIGEIREAKDCVQQVKRSLTVSGSDFDKNIELGIMIEIPSAALMADILAKEVDFFSIGTNDLCQYTLAVDRMNERISTLYNHFNPAVLRLIHFVIEQGYRNNIPVGMCGEMASDPLAALLLVGMGLEEFSMGAASIPVIKQIILNTPLSKARDVFNKIRDMDNSDSITAYLKDVSA